MFSVFWRCHLLTDISELANGHLLSAIVCMKFKKAGRVMRNGEKRGVVVGLTMAVFLLGYGLLLLTGVTNIRHLLDNAIASYLLAWALYGMFARVPLSEVGARFLLTTSALIVCWLLAESAVLLGLIDYRHVAWEI
jgi:hypothetical protein